MGDKEQNSCINEIYELYKYRRLHSSSHDTNQLRAEYQNPRIWSFFVVSFIISRGSRAGPFPRLGGGAPARHLL